MGFEARLDVGRGDVVGGDAVVVRVDGLDEVVVELLEQGLGFGRVLGQAGARGDYRVPEVQVDQARGGQLCVARGEAGAEGPLVVVVAVRAGIVFSAYVDHGVAGRQEGGVARAEERRVGVGGEQAEEVDGQSFVGMKCAARTSVSGSGWADR